MKKFHKDDLIISIFAIVLAVLLASQWFGSEQKDDIIESDETYSEWIKSQ